MGGKGSSAENKKTNIGGGRTGVLPSQKRKNKKMKKLIIAAAAICAAVMANAAAANWKASASQIHDGTGSASALYSGTAYIFDAGVTSQSALFDIIAAGTAIGSSTAGYVTTATVTDGTFSGLNFSYGEQGSSDSISYYFVIVDTDKAYFSNEKGAKPNATATAKNMAFGLQYDDEDPTVYPNSVLAASGDGTTFAGAGRWNSTSSSVPEPTSGLLMLLGVAGLALRRRRA